MHGTDQQVLNQYFYPGLDVIVGGNIRGFTGLMDVAFYHDQHNQPNAEEAKLWRQDLTFVKGLSAILFPGQKHPEDQMMVAATCRFARRLGKYATGQDIALPLPPAFDRRKMSDNAFAFLNSNKNLEMLATKYMYKLEPRLAPALVDADVAENFGTAMGTALSVVDAAHAAASAERFDAELADFMSPS